MKDQKTPGWMRQGRWWWLAGWLALGYAAPLRSEIISFSYTNATVTSGTSSAYLGFNPATGDFMTTDSIFGSGLNNTYNAMLLANNVGGPGVTFYPWDGAGVSSSNPYVSMAGSFGEPAGFVDYVAADAVVDGSRNYGSNLQLSNLSIGDTGFMAMSLRFDETANDYFGWAKIQRTADESYTLLATAYNTAPNESIQAGLAAIPEPASGLLVVISCAGIILWRRRPRTKAFRF